MALSNDLTLPKSKRAVFPDKCIVCGTAKPGATIRITTHSIGWWTVALLSFGWPFSCRVPACKSCGKRLRIQRWINHLAIWVLIAILVWFLVPIVRGWVPRPWDRWATAGVIVVCISPLLFWEVLFPPVVDVTAKSETVDYQFRDATYAVEFADLNGSAAHVPMHVYIAKAQASVDEMIRRQCEELGDMDRPDRHQGGVER